MSVTTIGQTSYIWRMLAYTNDNNKQQRRAIFGGGYRQMLVTTIGQTSYIWRILAHANDNNK